MKYITLALMTVCALASCQQQQQQQQINDDTINLPCEVAKGSLK